MDQEHYARLLGQITVLELALDTLIEHAPAKARSELKQELQNISDRDSVSDSDYGGSMTATAERLLERGRLRR